MIGIRSNSVDLLERIRREVLLPEWNPKPLAYHFIFSILVGGQRGRGRRDFHILYDQTERVARSLDLESVMRDFEQRLHQKIMQFPFYKTALRAAAISLDGVAHLYLGEAAQALPERAEELRAKGARLLAPQYSLIDDEGLVHPYHNRSDLESTLNLPRCENPVRLRKVWAGPEACQALSPAHCAWQMFSHLVNVNDAPARMQGLGRLVAELEVVGAQGQKQQ